MDQANDKRTKPSLRGLFLNMLYISALTFGGGFVIVSLMKKKFVDELGWLHEDEMLDLTALAQSSPGAMAVNAAMLMGWRFGGFLGMLTGLTASILPALVLLTVISYGYAAFASNPYIALALQGMQAGVAAVIMDVVLSTGARLLRSQKVRAAVLMALAFTANTVLHVNVVYIILAAVLIGAARFLLERRRGHAG